MSEEEDIGAAEGGEAADVDGGEAADPGDDGADMGGGDGDAGDGGDIGDGGGGADDGGAEGADFEGDDGGGGQADMGDGLQDAVRDAMDMAGDDGGVGDGGDGGDGFGADDMDGAEEPSPETIERLTGYSWNVFRYIGDCLHLFGIAMILFTLAKNKSCRGISRSTQILYFCVFISRYLDLVDHSQTAYLVFFKLTYTITSVIILSAFWVLHSTYERQKDTCSLTVIFIPCVMASILLASEYSFLEILWTLSQFLEGFAMVPQYIFCYRDRSSKDIGVTLYVMCLGGYRVFYALNWIYKKIQMPEYSDYQSWTGGMIEISFFLDYLLGVFNGSSLLRAVVLQVDDKITAIHDKVGMTVRGSGYNPVSTSGDHSGELRQRRGAREDGPNFDV